MPLIFSISGLRGTIGDGLTPLSVLEYTVAFHNLFRGERYMTGRDTRPHGEWIHNIVNSVLNALGADVLNLNIVPTPTLNFNVRNSQVDGGIIITASHNPENWNALKFVGSNGMFLFPEEIEKLSTFLTQSPSWANHEEAGKTYEVETAIDNHINAILQELGDRLEPVKSRKPKVVLDCVNGAMYRALPALMESLELDTIALFCDPSGKFPHNPEPRPEHLTEIDKILKRGDADLGFAVDPDGDRLIFGLKGFGMLSEEFTLPVAVNEVLKFKKGDVVINLSTSMMNEFVAKRYGVAVTRTPVGEINVTKKLIELDGAIGGEGNGGVIYPPVNLCRDGLLGAALVLSAYGGGYLFDFIDSLPKYHRIKTKVPLSKSVDLRDLTGVFNDAKIDTQDGLYFRWDEMWLHIRKSNTEPVIRILGEGKDEGELNSRLSKVKNWLANRL